MKINKSDLIKMIKEETAAVLSELRGAGQAKTAGTKLARKKGFTRAGRSKAKRQRELYKQLGGDFVGNPKSAAAAHQMKLGILGYDIKMPKTFKGTAEPDGVYGKETIDATRAFQKSVGMQPDGLLGPDTHEQMELVLKGQVKPNAPKDVMDQLMKNNPHLRYGDEVGQGLAGKQSSHAIPPEERLKGDERVVTRSEWDKIEAERKAEFAPAEEEEEDERPAGQPPKGSFEDRRRNRGKRPGAGA